MLEDKKYHQLEQFFNYLLITSIFFEIKHIKNSWLLVMVYYQNPPNLKNKFLINLFYIFFAIF